MTSLPATISGDGPARLRAVESWLTAVVVAMLSNAVIGPVFDPTQQGGDSVSWLRLVWIPVYAVIALLALVRRAEMGRFWRPLLLVGVLVLWAGLSAVWATDPATAGRRALALVFTTLFGVYLSSRFNGRELSRLLAATFFVLALAALVVCLAAPAFGVDHGANEGAWKGLWYEKNAMGTTMAYGAMSAIAAAWDDRRRWLWLLFAIPCVGLVIMSRGMTSIVVLAGAVAFMAMTRWARRGPIASVVMAWLSVTFAGLIAIAVSFAPDPFYRLFGKDPTLTGRTDIWRSAEHWAAQSPWLGYGYESFWTDSFAPARYIRAQLGWLVPNAHNSWLDLRLELGWIGLALTVCVFVVVAVAVLVRGWRLRDGGWAAAFFITFIFSALTETLILEQNNLSWCLCVAAIARLLGPVRREKAPPADAAAVESRAAVANDDGRAAASARRAG